MHDRFSTGGDSITAPARRAFAITPDDADTLPFVTKGLCIGGTGQVVLRCLDNDSDVTMLVMAGQILPIRVTHVRATGTTATGLVGLS